MDVSNFCKFFQILNVPCGHSLGLQRDCRVVSPTHARVPPLLKIHSLSQRLLPPPQVTGQAPFVLHSLQYPYN